jgi:ribosomal protein S24E
MSVTKSVKRDKSNALVTRAQVVAAIRHMVEHDEPTRAAIRALVARPSLWQRVKRFFRQGR